MNATPKRGAFYDVVAAATSSASSAFTALAATLPLNIPEGETTVGCIFESDE